MTQKFEVIARGFELQRAMEIVFQKQNRWKAKNISHYKNQHFEWMMDFRSGIFFLEQIDTPCSCLSGKCTPPAPHLFQEVGLEAVHIYMERITVHNCGLAPGLC